MAIPNFPRAIEIQTTSACNAKCIICPHNSLFKSLPQGIMADKLFIKILEEVGDKELLLIPYFNGEPFLDPFFFRRLDQIKEKCKNVKLEISTNASMLTKEKAAKLSKYYIDDLRLSVFGFTQSTHSKMMPGLNWETVKTNLDYLVNHAELRKNIQSLQMIMIYFSELTDEDISLAKAYCKKHNIKLNLWGFLDRGGNVKGYSNKAYQKKVTGCSQNRPIERLHILYNGDILLCCQDWKREYVLGNLKKDSIQNIWLSKEYTHVRNSIYLENNPPELCRRCILSTK